MASTHRSESVLQTVWTLESLPCLQNPVLQQKGNFLLLISLQSILKLAARQLTDWFCNLIDTSIASITSMENYIFLFSIARFAQKPHCFYFYQFLTYIIVVGRRMGLVLFSVFPLLHLDSGLNQRTSRGSRCSFTTKL